MQVPREPRDQRTQPRRLGAATARVERGVALIRDHRSSLLSLARSYSLCADDAEDAYQRAVEILITKSPTEPTSSLLAWMRVVTRREALAVRRRRERLLAPHRLSRESGAERDPLDGLACARPGPAEQLERAERSDAAARALAELKPAERRAVALQAAGCSYAEIQAITGWSYTKVNRCLAEGREALGVTRKRSSAA